MLHGYNTMKHLTIINNKFDSTNKDAFRLCLNVSVRLKLQKDKYLHLTMMRLGDNDERHKSLIQ
jgi:hypothetical protein